MKRLIVSEQRLQIEGYCSKSFEEFKNMTLSKLLQWDEFIFAFESMTQEKANIISITAGRRTSVQVLCSDVEKCMGNFKNLLNINNSKDNIEFIPELFDKERGILILLE